MGNDEDATEAALEAAMEHRYDAVEDALRAWVGEDEDDPGILTSFTVVYTAQLLSDDGGEMIGYLYPKGMSLASKVGLAELLHLRAKHWADDE